MSQPIMGVLGVPLARLVQAVTSITLVNNTSKTEDVTVPAGKRWRLLGIKITNPDDVQRAISITKYKEAAKTNIIRTLVSYATLGAGGEANWPNSRTALINTNELFHEEILDAGNIISVTWVTGGASTGGTDADGLVVEYLEVDV